MKIPFLRFDIDRSSDGRVFGNVSIALDPNKASQGLAHLKAGEQYFYPLPLSFASFRSANLRRLPLFKNRAGEPAHSQPDGSDWNIAMWTNAIAGEVGEACNLAKKIERGDFGAAGSAAHQIAMHELAKELADVVTYADIACFRTGHSLGDVVVEKFNEVSKRVGCEVQL